MGISSYYLLKGMQLNLRYCPRSPKFVISTESRFPILFAILSCSLCKFCLDSRKSLPTQRPQSLSYTTAKQQQVFSWKIQAVLLKKKKNFFCFFSEKNCNVPAVTCTDMVASEWDFQLFSYYLSFWASVEGTKFVFGAGLMTWWETTTVFLFHVRTGSPVFIREPEMVQGQGQSHVAEATKCFQHSTQQTAAHQRVTWWKYDCVSEHGNERLGLLSVLREQ